MPKNQKQQGVELRSGVHEPPCAATGRTSPARNASTAATATIARAAILRTVVAAATAPTRAAPGVAGMD